MQTGESSSESESLAPYRPPSADVAYELADVRSLQRAANANALLWALGNGMVSLTLVTYLAGQFGAEGIWISLVVAAPQLIGAARLAAAPLAGRHRWRKPFCVGNYAASGVLLLGLPALALGYAGLTRAAALALLVTIWGLYHLLEYLATVILWAWFRDLVPAAHRGLFIGRRERWLAAGRMMGMLGAGLFALRCQGIPSWLPYAYAAPAALGALLLTIAAVPLCYLPTGSSRAADGDAGPTPSSPDAAPRRRDFRWRQFLTLVVDRRLSRLLIYGCWFSFFNGLTQAPQGLLPIRILSLNLIWLLAFRTAMSFGQSLVSAPLGRLADRIGNRPVLIASQVIVAIGLAGYMLATPEHWWLLGFAWFSWIAYAGINICVPNLLLKLSPPAESGPCVAGYFAVTGVFFGLSTVVGGFVFDMLHGSTFLIYGQVLDRYTYLFLIGIVTRMIGAIFLLAIDEPRPDAAVEASLPASQ